MVCQQNPMVTLLPVLTILLVTVINYFYVLSEGVTYNQPDSITMSLESMTSLLTVDTMVTICAGGITALIFWIITR